MTQSPLLSCAAIALFALACGPTDPPGRSGGSIVGGSVFHDLPAVGALTYYGNSHCTGTLIAPKKILTAAHCVDGVNPAYMHFVVGDSLSQPEHVLAVASVAAHPAYNASSITNDIAYVTLKQAAPIAPMPVLESMSALTGASLLFVGYGVSDGISQTGSGIKRSVWLTVDQIGPTTFSYSDPGKNTCNGDSGGPAFHQGNDGTFSVVGVTSYGDAGCQHYGVDTRVDAYADFLDLSSDEPSTDGCQGETAEGRCDDGTLIFCDDGAVEVVDCDAYGYECAFDGDNHACTAASDPCDGETFAGRCDGDTVIWCENNEVLQSDCGAKGGTCGFSDANQFFDCQ